MNSRKIGTTAQDTGNAMVRIKDIFRRKEPLDFATIIGSCTRSARNFGANWDNANIAVGTDRRAQELAKYFVDYHRELFGKPGMNGLLESSGGMSNFRALELARDSTGRTKVLCTNLTHISIEQACNALQLEPLVLDADPMRGYQVDEADLADKVSRFGKSIAAVVSTHGTTQLGHVERLAEIDLVRQLREDGSWLHIDAAYGGYIAQLSTRSYLSIPEDLSIPLISGDVSSFSSRITGLPDADSITIDPYKFVGKPGCSLLLVAEDKTPRIDVPYYTQSPYTLHTTFSAGPLAAWSQTLKDYGLEGLQCLADGCVHVARQVAIDLMKRGVFLIRAPRMGIVPFALGTAEEAKRMRANLLDKGFVVGGVQITGSDYEMNGLRIVITPKIEPEFQFANAMKLTRIIAEMLGL